MPRSSLTYVNEIFFEKVHAIAKRCAYSSKIQPNMTPPPGTRDRYVVSSEKRGSTLTKDVRRAVSFEYVRFPRHLHADT